MTQTKCKPVINHSLKRHVSSGALAIVFYATLAMPLSLNAIAENRTNNAETYGLMQTLNARLQQSSSATLTLENWCSEHQLAKPPVIKAHVLPTAFKTPDASVLSQLAVEASQPLAYRKVELRCGKRVLSVAENWYVPARLAAEMNTMLATSHTPFGKAIAPLKPYRKTTNTIMLWSGSGNIPPALFEHHATVYDADHRPLAVVRETYQHQLLP
jgi:chorismate-pyruvate lyase